MYRTGLLLYVTNEEQTDFVAVQLNEGRLIVSYDDRGITRDIDSQSNLNDGLWHTVSIPLVIYKSTINVFCYFSRTIICYSKCL